MVDDKKILAGVEVLKEFKDKLTALCEEYRDKVQEVCPEDMTSRYFDSNNDLRGSTRLTRLQFDYSDGITRKELEDNGFVFEHDSDVFDSSYYRKEIDGIEIVCSIKKE